MKLRAVFLLETVEQVAAVVEFARSMEIKMEMGADMEPRMSRKTPISMGEVNPKAKDNGLFNHTKGIIAEQPGITRIDLVRALAKKTRKEPKEVGYIVKRWLKEGVLKGE